MDLMNIKGLFTLERKIEIYKHIGNEFKHLSYILDDFGGVHPNFESLILGRYLYEMKQKDSLSNLEFRIDIDDLNQINNMISSLTCDVFEYVGEFDNLIVYTNILTKDSLKYIIKNNKSLHTLDHIYNMSIPYYIDNKDGYLFGLEFIYASTNLIKLNGNSSLLNVPKAVCLKNKVNKQMIWIFENENISLSNYSHIEKYLNDNINKRNNID